MGMLHRELFTTSLYNLQLGLELYRPQRLVLEDLRGFLKRVINNFPKAIKRVLIRFGLGEIKRKIEEVRE